MISLRTVFRGALEGRTLARILFYDALENRARSLSGKVLDLAGGPNPSYLPLLPSSLDIVRTDRVEAEGVRAVDINALLPFPDNSFDHVFLFNALYIVREPEKLAREVHRVLKKGGTWHVLSPFIANEMPEPEDFCRFTAGGLERLFRDAGFQRIKIERLGERASAATHLMHPFFLVRGVRALIFPLAILLDCLVPERVRREHAVPLSYWCAAKK